MNFRDNDRKLIVPYYVWGDIGAEDKDAKASRLASYLKGGGITPEYVMPYVIKSEELVLDKSLKLPQKSKEDREDKKEKNEQKKTSKELGKPKTSKFTFQNVEEVLRRI